LPRRPRLQATDWGVKVLLPWDTGCGTGCATSNRQRKKLLLPGTRVATPSAPQATTRVTKVFWFFFSKKNRFLPYFIENTFIVLQTSR
jgi:hypothetical protein